MIKLILDNLELLHGAYFYPEIAIVCFLVYFVLRQRWNPEGTWSILATIPLSLLGELAFSWPTSKQGWSLALFMAAAQWGIGTAAYSLADKYGWMDRLGKRIARKIDNSGGTTNETDPASPSV